MSSWGSIILRLDRSFISGIDNIIKTSVWKSTCITGLSLMLQFYRQNLILNQWADICRCGKFQSFESTTIWRSRIWFWVWKPIFSLRIRCRPWRFIFLNFTLKRRKAILNFLSKILSLISEIYLFRFTWPIFETRFLLLTKVNLRKLLYQLILILVVF